VLELAGGANVFADVREESVQPSQETLITRQPDVVVELHPEREAPDLAEAKRAWSALAATPAVRGNRVHVLAGAYLAIAGPRLGDAAETVGRALHPEAFK
jgi:iron complex transport system substrate-binding protein